MFEKLEELPKPLGACFRPFLPIKIIKLTTFQFNLTRRCYKLKQHIKIRKLKQLSFRFSDLRKCRQSVKVQVDVNSSSMTRVNGRKLYAWPTTF